MTLEILEQNSLFLAYFAICFMATLPIYFGAFAAKPKESEQFSTADAYWFPVFGSFALLSLYLVFKFFDGDYVNFLLGIYFNVAGIFAIITALDALDIKAEEYEIKLSYAKKAVAVAIVGAYVYTKHWILSNIIGLCFSFTALVSLRLDSFRTGAILLSGLFIYDIFWVFGTDVMVSVAKNVDAPIKLLFPKNVFDPKEFTMLGLGDIVIPGIWVALCRRFDATLGRKLNFFYSTFFAYVAGLVTTIVVMHTFRAAQPALLYLCPACLLSVVSTALITGNIGAVWNYSEEEKKEIKNEKSETSSEKADKDHSFSGSPEKQKQTKTQKKTIITEVDPEDTPRRSARRRKE